MEINTLNYNEVVERMKAIDELDENTLSVEELRSNNEEYEKLEVRFKELEAEKEKRSALLNTVKNLPDSAVIKNFEEPKEARTMEFTKETVLKAPEYRSAWAKSLMQLPLTETEQRALGVALTTTSTTYTAATAEANGVNNGGLFIPEEVMMDLMAKVELVSPFLRDVPKTSITGYVKFPYRVGGSGAAEQAEGVSNSDGQVQWAELELKVLEVSETIRVTWKLEAMAVDSFINYITDELAVQIGEKIAGEVLHGDGTGSVKGVTAAGIDGTYTIGTSTGNVADVYEAISEGIKLLPKKKQIGAKIYVATDIMQAMSFARDDEGRFMHNPINGVGINSFGKFPIEEDPFLNNGEFVIGNPRYYKLNWNEPLSITKDVSGKQRINDYTGYALVAGNAEPNSFVYGKKSS